jgi:type II secretory pathway pseudopilin PulG
VTASAPSPVRGRESGFTLLVAVAVAVVLGTLLLVTAQRVADVARDGDRDRAALSATYAAQGGVEAARAALARDPSWTGGTFPVGRGEAIVAAAPVAGDADLRAVVVLGRHPWTGGASAEARTRVEVRLRLRPGLLPEIRSWR